MTPSVVLSRASPCNVPQGYASVAELPAALLDGLFEHPTHERKGGSMRKTEFLATACDPKSLTVGHLMQDTGLYLWDKSRCFIH